MRTHSTCLLFFFITNFYHVNHSMYRKYTIQTTTTETHHRITEAKRKLILFEFWWKVIKTMCISRWKILIFYWAIFDLMISVMSDFRGWYVEIILMIFVAQSCQWLDVGIIIIVCDIIEALDEKWFLMLKPYASERGEVTFFNRGHQLKDRFTPVFSLRYK